MELPRANVPQLLSSNPEIEIKQYGNGFKFALLNREGKTALGSQNQRAAATQLESGSYFQAKISWGDWKQFCRHSGGMHCPNGPLSKSLTSGDSMSIRPLSKGHHKWKFIIQWRNLQVLREQIWHRSPIRLFPNFRNEMRFFHFPIIWWVLDTAKLQYT